MRLPWVGIGCVFLTVTLLAGCKTSTPQLKPPSTPETLASPPVGDSRYDFANYPKEALAFNTNNDQRKIGNGGGPTGPSFGGPGGGGMGGGMGGMGGMAGR
jgi:hypothetical protein